MTEFVFEGWDFKFPDEDDHIARQVNIAKTFYEIPLLLHLREHVPAGGTIVDCGAHWGNHSLFFATFMADHVYALEPQPDNFEMLEATLNANDIPEITPARLAVGGMAGTHKIGLSDESGNSGMYTLRNPVHDVSDINMVTIDGLLESHALPVTLIKLDVEGCELDALEGAEKTIDKHAPHISVECHTTQQLDDIHSFLAAWDYKQMGQFCATPTYHFAPSTP